MRDEKIPHIKRPRGGFKWERPGFRFSLDPVWPPGFEPQPIPKGMSAWELSASCSRGREKARAAGHTGTILGLSPKADEILANSKFRDAKAKKAKPEIDWREVNKADAERANPPGAVVTPERAKPSAKPGNADITPRRAANKRAKVAA